MAQTCLRDAEALKVEGNDHFRASRWNEALVAYRSALGRLPRRKFVERKPKEDSARGRKKWDIKGKGREEDDEEEGGEKAQEAMGAVGSSGDIQGESQKADGEAGQVNAEKAEEKVEKKAVKLSPLEMECAKARSVLNANIGACHIKLVRFVLPSCFPCQVPAPVTTC